MNIHSRVAAYMFFMFILTMPFLALANVLVEDGEPVMSVRDPAKAAAVGRLKAQTPPLKAGQLVLLVDTRGEMGTVSVRNPKSSGIFNDYQYQLPMAALQYLPGKTHLERPAWLPAPAAAGTEARDVVVYVNDAGDLFVRVGQTARSLPQVRTVPGLYGVAPNGSLMAYTPVEGNGVFFLRLDAADNPWKAENVSEMALGPTFSPDGSMVAWRSAVGIEMLDVSNLQGMPRVAVQLPSNEDYLIGFSSNSRNVMASIAESAAWVGPDGNTLRSLPLSTFLPAGNNTEGAQFVPSPVDANLTLVACATRGTEAYHKWADDVSGAIYIYDAASDSNYRLTPKNLAAASPAWSPDGKRIYFNALPDTPARGQHHIYRINADGTGFVDLGPGAEPKVGIRP